MIFYKWSYLLLQIIELSVFANKLFKYMIIFIFKMLVYFIFYLVSGHSVIF